MRSTHDPLTRIIETPVQAFARNMPSLEIVIVEQTGE